MGLPRIQIIFLQVLSPNQRRIEVVDSEAFSIGRFQDVDRNDSTFIGIQGDAYVGRLHSRMYRKQNRWWLVDLDSKNGTFLEGERLGAKELLPVQTGMIIRTGNTVWTICAANEIMFRWNDILIWGQFTGYISHLLLHCRKSFIHNLMAKNIGKNTSRSFEFIIEIDPCFTIPPIQVPSLESMVDCELDITKLQKIIIGPIARERRYRSSIRVLAHDIELLANQSMIDILGLQDLNLQPHSLFMAAAFVRPHVQELRICVTSIEENIRVAKSETCQGGTPSENCVLLVYNEILNRFKYDYALPTSSSLSSAGTSYQTVRQIEELCALASSGDRTVTKATCIDLSLLILSLGESVGLCPVLIFSGKSPDEIDHAMAAFWVGNSPGVRTFLNQSQLNKVIQDKHLIPIESTGLAYLQSRSDKTLTFEQAKAAALEKAYSAEYSIGLNIQRLRKPPYDITPL